MTNTNQINSQYDCADAGTDLHELKQQLSALQAEAGPHAPQATMDKIHQLKNQIEFIKNKCDIHP
ncbi:hypothetical protein [Paenibacillus rigui]|uniref:DUF2524 domain-containing protein n=1 Tax=Paenibacillus rigui TaxID=554312 RepID=A0A229UXF2_9BACL|nr:hypothetical protein [Paenibacillus rigui]OXM88156.1 DUF2524 domain-containing protein [Paenibacillus rigui]